MTRTITPKVPKTSEFYDKLAVHYFNEGVSPQEVIDSLKACNYQVATTTGVSVAVEATVVANIVRGLHLASTLKPTTKTRSRKVAKA